MKKEVLIEKANQLYKDVVAEFPRIGGWKLTIFEEISQFDIIPVFEDFIGMDMIKRLKEMDRGCGFVFYGIEMRRAALLFSAF